MISDELKMDRFLLQAGINSREFLLKKLFWCELRFWVFFVGF
jgi:hypothetical protein